ncbi:hypothetical protein BKG82_27665 [Mycobacteroides chelonae]|uniref:HD domain-containing protein n=1 Tax=Mycobacteroides chelonae TaxID=1774 RepID=A0A1S1LHX0_MYCCH|nr:HD domain-containing protein [Mycobacteroides chelonae]OHU47389.1 hypothetical protein BKG82_27665 [Mycobacteroides chelonae]
MESIDVIADRIAARAHEGQVDKSGVDYIAHLRRVAQRVQPNTVDARAAALLHDVLEDTSVTPDELTLAGMPPHVVRAVELLTRRRGLSNSDYYAQIRGNALALAVKLADIADNSDPSRLSSLDLPTQQRLREKYSTARQQLSGR